MPMDDVVSLIVPVYNTEKYLRACLTSIIKQTYSNIEVIVIDDGSTDNSKTIVDEFVCCDSRIKLFHQENSGLSAARNIGIKKSTGNLIMFVDSDDFISEFFVETCVRTMKKTDADIVCSESLNFIDGDDANAYRKLSHEKNIEYIEMDPELALKCAFYQSPSITGAYLKLYRRYLFEKVLFPIGMYYEDLATTYKYMLLAKKIVFINRKFYAYRIRKDGIMNEPFSNKKMACVVIGRSIVNDSKRCSIDVQKAAYTAAFRANRIVFAQVAANNSNSEVLWGEIKKYRYTVWKDNNAKKYERFLAGISYLGESIFRLSLIIFSFFRATIYWLRLFFDK